MSRSIVSLAGRNLRSATSISPHTLFQTFASSRIFTVYHCQSPLSLRPSHNARCASTATAVAPSVEDDVLEHNAASSTTPPPAETAEAHSRFESASRWAAPSLSEEDAALFPSELREVMDQQVSRWKHKVAARGDGKPVNTRLRGARRARREARERGEVVEEKSAVEGARVADTQFQATKREKTSSRRPKEAGTRPAKKKERKPRRSIQTSPEDEEITMIEQAKQTAQQQESHRQQFLAEQRERTAKGLPDPPLDTTSSLPAKPRDFHSPFFAPQSSSPKPTPTRSSQTPTPAASTSNPKPTRLRPDAPPWQIQKHALATKFTTGWNPRRKLSPDARLGIRDLHFANPELYTTPVLAEQFRVSPEAIRRILRSKWIDKVANLPRDEFGVGGASRVGSGFGSGSGSGSASGCASARGLLDTPLPTIDASRDKKMDELRKRWAKRYERIWDRKSELGLLPKRGKERGVEDGEEGRERWEEEMVGREVLERGRGEHVL